MKDCHSDPSLLDMESEVVRDEYFSSSFESPNVKDNPGNRSLSMMTRVCHSPSLP